jgi:1-phosphofructokinase
MALGVKNRAFGFVAGEVGEMLESGLHRLGVDTDFVHLAEGNTRINVKITAQNETELNAVGPAVDAAAFEQIAAQVAALADGDTLCLCGSVPPGCGTDTYARLLQRVEGKDIRTVVDATGELLLNTLSYRPHLIKPNRDELCALTGRDLPDDESVLAAARDLQAKGARNVLVSLGGDGALLLTEDGAVYRRAAYRGTVRGTVGAGDSTVAGYLAAIERGADAEDALRLAVAAGSATAFSDGLATREAIEALLAKCE